MSGASALIKKKGDTALKKKKLSARGRTEAIWGLAFITPTIVGLLILNYYPIFETVYQSLCKTGDFGIGNTFIGLENFKTLFQDKEVFSTLFNSFKYAVLSLPLTVAISLVLAVLLNRKMKMRSVYRTVFFLPMVCAPAAVAMVWKWMFNQDYGLLNHLLGTKVNWVTSPALAMIAIVIVGVWSSIGNNMILLLGGLQDIPKDYYEAAAVDGSTGVHSFFHITIPLLSPMLFFIIQTGIMGALQLFDLPFMIMDQSSRAWPSVKTITYLFYEYAFEKSNRGYGAAIIMFLICIISFLTFLLQKSEKKWVHYE
jgi:multiple sugar transport system permease protein